MSRSGQKIHTMEWFQRKFDFNLPLWMYPNVVERLRGAPARLEDRVREIPAESLTRRVGDPWSIQENIGHLWDLEPLFAGRVEDFVAGLGELRPADLENRKTHEANHNARRVTDLLLEFRQTRMQTIQRLDELGEDVVGRTAQHPRLQQPMRLLDSVFFMAEHDDHHLAKITELVDDFRNP